MTWSFPATRTPPVAEPVLREIEQRVLWLATAIVDHADRVRPNASGLKVGGHQASSASVGTIMTSLWLEQLRAEDRVSVEPHASPVLHAPRTSGSPRSAGAATSPASTAPTASTATRSSPPPWTSSTAPPRHAPEEP